MNDDIQELERLLDARVKLIVAETRDETRVLHALSALALGRNLRLLTWTASEGLVDQGLTEGEGGPPETRDPEAALRRVKAEARGALCAFCDLHPYLEDQPRVVRLLKDLSLQDHPDRPTLVLISHALRLPPELAHLAARFTPRLPGESDLQQMMGEEARGWRERNRGALVEADGEALQQLASNLRGLPHHTARTLVRRAIWDDGSITPQDVPRLIRNKFQLLDLQGVLTLEPAVAGFQEVGGLRRLKQWLDLRRQPFLKAGAADAPKGVLLVGVQGGGKSLAAKAVAGSWGLPLLRLDFGCLYNKWFGETERNLREALKQADLMAPCVLWLDEMEKGLSTGIHDEGVSQRLLGHLLTWMAERRSRVFLVATSNDIERLPPELVRKGRFDEIFYVDLPDEATRARILAIHLERRGLTAEAFNLPALAADTAGFSGAELEQVVLGAQYASQARGEPCTDGDLAEAARSTAPLSRVMAEAVDALRVWAQDRAVRAD